MIKFFNGTIYRNAIFQAKHVALVFCCIYLVIANWMAWTRKILSSSLLDLLASFYKMGTDVGGLPRVPRNQLYVWIVSSTFWGISTYAYVLKFYLEGLLWASAWTLYSIEQKARSYTMNEDAFEINVVGFYSYWAECDRTTRQKSTTILIIGNGDISRCHKIG
jgi:hypothetical protein